MSYDFSIVVTSYNQKPYIQQCLRSLTNQIGVKYELIVADDCSQDGTKEIIGDFLKSLSIPTLYINRERNIGMLKNLKDAIQQCKGKYIAICEGDDYWIDDNKLRKIKEGFEKYPLAKFCFTNIELDVNGLVVDHLKEIKKNLKDGYINIEQACLPYNCIANFSCCAYEKEVFSHVPSEYWESGGADLLLHLYILDKYHGIYLSNICSRYRIRNDASWSGLSSKEKFTNLLQMYFEYNEKLNYRYSNLFSRCIAEEIERYIDLKMGASKKSPVKKAISRINSFFKRDDQ